MAHKKDSAVNKAWEYLIEKFNILTNVRMGNVVHLSSDDLNATKKVIEAKGSIDARLMAKFDTAADLPPIFQEFNLDILPTGRGHYVVSDFILYHRIPDLEDVESIKEMNIKFLESLDANNITNENTAILAASISGILEDFLQTDKNIMTLSSRMGTGEFSFYVERKENKPIEINVRKAQIEIDGGFENSDSIVLVEAKNVLNEDFNIRQLYYPLRTWSQKLKKPIRNLFLIYVNKTFFLFEYRFKDLNNFSSIELVKSGAYILNQTKLSFDNLLRIHRVINPEINDSLEDSKVPFPQADSFYRIISLMEAIDDADRASLNNNQITELMGLTTRQTSYYTAAGVYLGVFDRIHGYTFLTDTGKQIVRADYSDRIFFFARLLFKHQIFSDTFSFIVENIGLEEYAKSIGIEWRKHRTIVKRYVMNRMEELNILDGEAMINRRSQTVIMWLKWLSKQIKY